ncbi:hypothetical protein [Kitasatospora sp. NPDC057015]|uniref:hypothetical protein n=1 Tax=Kitasatospora sp. NPDC057015 TaxID=3346001 RepID=UPI0036439DDF
MSTVVPQSGDVTTFRRLEHPDAPGTLPHSGQPDVAFAVHPQLGILAAVTDHLPTDPAGFLTKAGWQHLPHLDVYAAPPGGLDAVAEATVLLRQDRYVVAVEPALATAVLTRRLHTREHTSAPVFPATDDRGHAPRPAAAPTPTYIYGTHHR